MLRKILLSQLPTLLQGWEGVAYPCQALLCAQSTSPSRLGVGVGWEDGFISTEATETGDLA